MDIHWEYIHARIYNANTQVVDGPQVSIRVRCTRVYRYYGTDRSATIKKSATSIVFVRNGCVYEHIYRVYTLLDLLRSPYRVFERSIEDYSTCSRGYAWPHVLAIGILAISCTKEQLSFVISIFASIL